MTRMPAAILAAVLGAAALAGPAFARSDMAVDLPDTASLPDAQARALLTEVAQVNVITSNCPAYGLSDAEWTLITGTGDRLAAQLALDGAAYDTQFYAPAFRLLDDPGACDRIGPTAPALIARLKSMGGGTTAEGASQ